MPKRSTSRRGRLGGFSVLFLWDFWCKKLLLLLLKPQKHPMSTAKSASKLLFKPQNPKTIPVYTFSSLDRGPQTETISHRSLEESKFGVLWVVFKAVRLGGCLKSCGVWLFWEIFFHVFSLVCLGIGRSWCFFPGLFGDYVKDIVFESSLSHLRCLFETKWGGCTKPVKESPNCSVSLAS